ncbi:glycosyltransferase [Patescibacteria group bacterium]|nr:glycosyltransferase [Patescibacteria group bacterium]
MKNEQILFIVHRLYFNGLPKQGGIDHIIDFLARQNQISLIEHPFEKINHPSTFTSGVTTKQHWAFTRPPLLWIEECLVNLAWILQTHERFSLAIASDPLNFFSCYVLKKWGLAKMIQFHSIDYSSPRFNNALLEGIYQRLYRFALNHADLVTLVSQRMLHQAKTMASVNHQRRFFLLPNSPVYDTVPKQAVAARNKLALVMTAGIFKNQVDMKVLLCALKRIKSLMPNFTLHIVSAVDKDDQEEFVKAGLKNNIVFHGALSRPQSTAVVAGSYIGISCYKKNASYMTYADSLKIREYAAAGLPTVCDNIYSTSDEIKQYNTGFVYNDYREMADVVLRLIKDESLYRRLSQNALAWAKKMDKINWLKKIYDKPSEG